MLDPKLLRTPEGLERIRENLARRGGELDVDRCRELEEQRKRLQVEADELRNRRNTESRAIGKAKAAGEDIQPLLDAVKSLGDELGKAEAEFAGVKNRHAACLRFRAA